MSRPAELAHLIEQTRLATHELACAESRLGRVYHAPHARRAGESLLSIALLQLQAARAVLVEARTFFECEQAELTPPQPTRPSLTLLSLPTESRS